MKTEAAVLPVARSRAGDLLALTKPRLNSLVVLTAGVGYYLGMGNAPGPWLPVLVTGLHTVVGAALVAGGAAALNQISERDIDQRMERTRDRPMAAGRLSLAEARAFAWVLAVTGTLELAVGANLLAAAVAAVTLVSYVAIYTPLKRRTPWATEVGAVPGALPPVIGWVAARGALTVEAWILFGILFLWQLPHFHALSWMYRADFRRAGLPLIAVLDTDGRRTARHAVVYTAALLSLSLTPTLVGLTGSLYLAGAAALGVAFLVLATRFGIERSGRRARDLFHASLLYLPLLLGALVASRVN